MPTIDPQNCEKRTAPMEVHRHGSVQAQAYWGKLTRWDVHVMSNFLILQNDLGAIPEAEVLDQNSGIVNGYSDQHCIIEEENQYPFQQDNITSMVRVEGHSPARK